MAIDISVDMSSALSALTRNYAGVSVLSALRTLAWARMSRRPTQVMPRAKRAAAGPTATRDWMLLKESEVGGGVVDAGNTLVFAEVDGENIAGGRGRGASWVGAKVHADRDTLRLAEPA